MRLGMPRWYRIRARVGGVAMPAGFLLVAVGLLARLALPDVVPRGVSSALELAGFLLLLLGLVAAFAPVAPSIPARLLAPPVTGRWSAVNSPASNVPSHGIHANGQTFAIDLVYEPTEGARPEFGSGPAFRPPQDFPAFGQELLSPAEGRVVAVRDGARDHRSRSTWPAYAYMLLEGAFRELAGARQLLGNYLVIDLGDDSYAVFAHLQRGSVAVRPGDLVRRGDLVGRCGNSGNSSEPHLHFQLMDAPRPLVGAGLPFLFERVQIDGSPPRHGVPANEEAMVAASDEFALSGRSNR
jgi:murein DD-endopeptidase MepM/ murein hydrolase activator NlpD